MSGHTHKPRLSISGLVPPQQPSTPAGSETYPSPTIEQPDYTVLPSSDYEKLNQRLHDLRSCVAGIEKFESVENDSQANHHEASKMMADLSNDITRIQNMIGKCLTDYSKHTEILGVLRKERMEEFITRYNALLSVLLEVPSHIKFGMKTSVLSLIPAKESNGYRQDLDRKLARCDDLRAVIEEKVTKLEEGIEKFHKTSSDDLKIGKKTKYMEPNEYDTRPRRFHTAFH
ncbi:hypothetical protein ABW20_dc0109018 [Dactylellina cionopaga]|nr:hypothetical protein ABW20_dc0109018 [Dactylellina cionopaga]